MPRYTVNPRLPARLAALRAQAGLSYRQLGRAARYAHSYLWQVETGRKTPSPEFLSAVDSALNTGGELAEMIVRSDVLPGKEDRRLARALDDPSTDTVNDVRRRTALAMPAMAALTNAILTPTANGSDAAPATVDMMMRLATRAWRQRQSAQYTALSRLLPSLLIQIETSKCSLGGADRERAVRALVHTYNAASSLLRRMGDEHLALLAADRAVRTASTLDDSILIAAAMYRLANVLLSANRIGEAKTVALHAADLAGPTRSMAPRSVALWGGLLLTAAVAAARGQAESQAWELMGEAKAAARLLVTDHADIYSIFGPTNVAIHGVQVAIELRNGRDAVRRSLAVRMERLPASLLERRCQFLIDVAQGHVLEKNDAEAVTVLIQAERIAPEEIRFNGEVRRITEIMLSRERAGAVPELRRLAETTGSTK